ncbi:MAG: serine protease [Rhodospirillaceae bacterium]|jgi:S1-C subfamily serine protease|nr:serine protease [Rhodospirillaceae bacterium]
MTDHPEWEVPEGLRPESGDFAFDLNQALDAVVALRAEVPDDAFTASVLGTERAGNAVLIDPNGLAVTVGYLVTEAETVWLTTNDGTACAAHVVGYDFQSGMGLVQALGRLGAPHLELGDTTALREGDTLIAAGHGGRAGALEAYLVSKREFAGYWEYLLDEALFTAPAHPHWGGSALIGPDGTLVGVGSLLVEEARGEGRKMQGNMFMPAGLLDTVREDLLLHGRSTRPARPWLGTYTVDTETGPVVAGLAPDGPGEAAGLEAGDLVVEVAGKRVRDLTQMIRAAWGQGDAGVEIALTLLRQGEVLRVTVQTCDRTDRLKRPRLH